VVIAVRPFRLGADRLLDLPSAYASNGQTRTRQTGEIIFEFLGQPVQRRSDHFFETAGLDLYPQHR
jgi:hypothetical protein